MKTLIDSWKRLALRYLADGEMTDRELRAAMRAKMPLASRLLFCSPVFYGFMGWLEHAGLVLHEDRTIAHEFYRNGDPFTGGPRTYWATLKGHACAKAGN